MRLMLVLPFTLLFFVPLIHVQAAQSFFEKPKEICRSLEKIGMVTTRGWAKSRDFPGEYYCMSPMLEFGSPGRLGLGNNIALYVEGKQEKQADDITIRVIINNEAGREVALGKLLEATQVLLAHFDIPVPPELKEAILNAAPKKISTLYAEIDLVAPKNNMASYNVVFRPVH